MMTTVLSFFCPVKLPLRNTLSQIKSVLQTLKKVPDSWESIEPGFLCEVNLTLGHSYFYSSFLILTVPLQGK